MTSLPQKLKELQAVCEKATPGPWKQRKQMIEVEFNNEHVLVTQQGEVISIMVGPAVAAQHIATFDPPIVARLLETIRIQHEALKYVDGHTSLSKSECRACNCEKVIARVEKLWASGEAGE